MVRRFLAQKWIVVALSLLAVGGMTLLALGLHDVQFEPGHSLGASESASFVTSIETVVREVVEVPFWKLVLFWVLLVAMVVLVASMLSPEMRKWLLRSFISLISTVAMIYYLTRKGTLSLLNFSGIGSGEAAAAADDIAPIEPFSPPDVAPWAVYLISIGVVLALLFLTWRLLRWWQRLSRSRVSSDSLDDLAAIARTSLDDLQAGRDWDDVIVGCYTRMNESVSRRRGLFRTQAMTPAEFARRLEQAGLPGDPVRRLTRLFEAVRYGGQTSGQNEINEAVSCLNAILHYCGEAA